MEIVSQTAYFLIPHMLHSSPDQVDRLATFCRKWRVQRLSLFGSALRDDFRPDSDVDVLVEFEPDHGLSLNDWVEMIDELKAIFGREVDLVAKSGLKNPIRREEILKTSRVLYAA